MSLYKNKLNYSKIAKLFHWGFIIIFVYGISKQVDNIDQLKNIHFFRFEITFALIFLILLLVRFIYMKKTQKTSLPDETPKIQKIAAKMNSIEGNRRIITVLCRKKSVEYMLKTHHHDTGTILIFLFFFVVVVSVL